ncbi:MAG: response regulator [Nitrospinae bacterium]|nr:response regulator [Nitrospinota bacterium]
MDNKEIKIIILDDEESIRDILKRSLEKEGFTIMTSCDGNEAIELCIHERIQLVFSDILMPIMDGIVFLEKVKDTSPFTEVIMITGQSSLRKMAACMRKGAFAYIEKPFSAKDLLFLAKKAVEHSILRQELMDKVLKGRRD